MAGTKPSHKRTYSFSDALINALLSRLLTDSPQADVFVLVHNHPGSPEGAFYNSDGFQPIGFSGRNTTTWSSPEGAYYNSDGFQPIGFGGRNTTTRSSPEGAYYNSDGFQPISFSGRIRFPLYQPPPPLRLATIGHGTYSFSDTPISNPTIIPKTVAIALQNVSKRILNNQLTY